jgi:hypothetical protein
MMNALLLLGAGQGVPVPPPPPLPNSGEIHCDMRSEQGATFTLDGVLGVSEPRVEGKRFPQVIFRSEKLPELTGTFSAQWTTGGGRFMNADASGRVITEMYLITDTYTGGRAAIAAQVASYSGRTRHYFSGFCNHTLSYKRGMDLQ